LRPRFPSFNSGGEGGSGGGGEGGGEVPREVVAVALGGASRRREIRATKGVVREFNIFFVTISKS
jgi:hypothetical protein